MSISLQLAIRIQNTIDGPLQHVSRLSDCETWIGPVAMISHTEIKRVAHLLSSCIEILRNHHESPGL